MIKSLYRGIAPALMVSMASIAFETPAYAQSRSAFGETVADDGVRNRQRPEYDPIGIRAGSFMLYPTVDQETGYDSNPRNAPKGIVDDSFFYSIAPNLEIQSTWSRHALQFDVGSDSDFFLNGATADDNNTDIETNGFGRLDIGGQTSVSVDAGWQKGNEGRGDPESPAGAEEPTEFTTTRAGVTVQSGFNRLTYSTGIEATYSKYKDVDLIGGGIQQNGDRDQRTVEATARVGYEFSPGYTAFVRGSINNRDFQDNVDRSGNNRDSKGYEVNAGLQTEVTNLVTGEVFAGYLTQKYERQPTAAAQDLNDVNGVTFGTSLTWYPSPLLTANLRVNRSVEDTILPGASGRLATGVNASADYELRRNIIVTPSVGWSRDKYETDTSAGLIERNDTIVSSGLSATVLINRRASVEAGYDFTKRNSNIDSQDYNQHVLGMNLRLQI